MKFILNNLNKKYFLIFLTISIINITNEGIIQPDDILPLEITPSYDQQIGIKGTTFIFRFYVPNNLDKNGMPGLRGYGASNGQYIGITFNSDNTPFNTDIRHSCSMIQIDNNINIPLKPLNSEDSDYKTIYCQINSFDNTNIMLPGYNYKLTITMTDRMINNLDNLISITIFTTSSPKANSDILDMGTFNHINIIPPHNSASPINPIATLVPINTNLNIEVETDFNFDVKITFNDWFNWDNYIICLNLPKNQVNTENPAMTLSKPSGSYINIPSGTMNSINLETTDDRKYIGFYLDGSIVENVKNDILLMNFSGLKTKEAGLINEDDQNNNFIGVEIRYRNSYVICTSKKINFQISLGNVQFSVKHPETNIDENYIFDVFRGGAFQIEFTINTKNNVNNKYFVIRQKDSSTFQRVTFIASSCDFSNFNISSSNFNEIPKCHPIKNKNNLELGTDNFNGIFFYYPYIMKANTDYKLKIWMFFDECGPEDTELVYVGDREKVEINFYLEMYNNINKNKIGENRIESKYIFLNKISTDSGIVCYNTYMGDKKYNNGYTFNINAYASSNKQLLYREYFNWNIFKHSNTNEDNDGNQILNNLFESENITPKFIYSKYGNKLEEGSNILLVNKITLDSGNNEKLGQFYPMGLSVNPAGKIGAVKGKFFTKLSKSFFGKTLDSNGDTAKCYTSWVFGSPSITEDGLSWKPEPKFYPMQKYNFITNSKYFFQNEPTALFHPQIDNENIFDYYLISKQNIGWDETSNEAEWGFGDDESLIDQISDEAPVDIYFGFADTCHYWRNLEQTIYSLYTPIEIIIGITGETTKYSRVMRFIKLYPEAGVWHDNTIDEGNDIFVRSNDFIIKNHFAYNKDETDENSSDEKGVCLIEILNGVLDSQKALSSNFFLWIFMGSLLDTEYEQITSSYPVGNLPTTAKAYGYSSQHSLHPKNFYAKPSSDQNSDINTPIYNLATSMNSIYQSATSGYLFYLGSLIVFYNKVKSNSLYEYTSDPLVIPYYCPYYFSKGEKDPFSLGIFPAFVAGFGSFTSMTDFGNKGFEKLVAKKINNKQLNLIMLSGIKIVKDNNSELRHFYNTVKFINDYTNNLMTLDVWNSDENTPCDNEYDSIDSFIFFFNSKITDINLQNIIPTAYIPNQLKSLTKSKKVDYCFYVYGKQFCTGIYGITNSDLLLTRNTPNSRDKTPYLSINLNFEISQNLIKCENSDNFCPTDIIGYWGISSNHDMIQYVTNYKTDSFLLDYNIYRTYINNIQPKIELGQTMAFSSDPAIFLKLTFYTPFKTAILSNTKLSFNIKDVTNAKCSVQSHDVDLPSMPCNTIDGNIQCQLIDSSMKYNIFCYKLNYGSAGKFSFYNFKLNLPSEKSYSGLGTLIFEDSNEYPVILINSNIESTEPSIQAYYVTNPYNLNSYSKLELKIDLQRPAHPGMIIEIIFDGSYTDSFDANTECKFSLSRINSFSLNDMDMDEYWTVGNSIISNCIITSSTSTGPLQYIITAELEDKIYKAEKELSKYAYIYIWPFKSIVLDQYIYLSITVNGNYILSSTVPDNTKVYFSSINQYIDTTSSTYITSLFFISSTTSNIYGDLSDYTFKFSLQGLTIPNPISLAQIFFPKFITFECEECVKCYVVSSSGETTMITCNFEDNNILNIFFSNSIIQGSDDVSVLVTGIINPRTSITSAKLFLNLININSAGSRFTIFNSDYDLSTFNYVQISVSERLRFFYIENYVSNKNPRTKTDYRFRVGFDYANKNYLSFYPSLAENSLLYIYFPRDYHLYVNENPTDTIVTYNYINGISLPVNVETKILGRKIQILLKHATDSTVELKYIEITIKNIKNPNKIISSTENLSKSKYSGYFKVVCLNKPNSASTSQYYYTTGINSNTYRTDYIKDDSLRTNEYNWYRGNLIETDYSNKNKLIIDVLYNENTYNFIFLQPGRYIKVHFITSSEAENTPNFYINPDSTSISFPSNSIVKTLEESYTVPSLYGEPYEFYIGVPCSTNDGIYVVTPILSNTEHYIDPPSIVIYVRQIETAKIEFIQDNIGLSPLNAKTRIYYYLSDINVDDLTISWSKNFGTLLNKNINMDIIVIPAKSITDKSKRISNIFSTVNIKLIGNSETNTNYRYYFKSANNNKCYQLSPEDLTIQEMSSISYLSFDSAPNYKLTDDLVIKNSGNDANLLSNEIKFEFSPPILQISFILCELYCPYKNADDENKLLFLNYDSMNTYINSVKTNHFRKYSNTYFSNTLTTGSLTFSNVIKGYQYNAQCVYQTTQSNSNLINSKSYPLTSESLHSTYPTQTRCNTFYFVSPIDEEIQQKYINYCQYIMGKSFGYNSNGCIICSDTSGKITPPGYILYFPFNCQSEKCYDKSNSNYIEEMYRLSEEFNTNSKTSKYEFTICATSNRICPTQITENNFNLAFNQFVNNVKTTENVNQLFDIDYNDIKYIIYNGFYQNSIYVEDNINEDDISIEFITELSKNGTAIWKAYYNSEVNFNVLCFYRIKISTYQTPTMEEMINCEEGDTFCGIFVANYGGHEYEIPENKKADVVIGEYTMYITCSHFVPSPIYFTSIKSVKTMEIKEESFSGKLLSLKYINLFLFLIILL